MDPITRLLLRIKETFGPYFYFIGLYPELIFLIMLIVTIKFLEESI